MTIDMLDYGSRRKAHRQRWRTRTGEGFYYDIYSTSRDPIVVTTMDTYEILMMDPLRKSG